MSLDAPTKLEQLIDAWKMFQYKRTLIGAILGLILFGAVLYAVDRISAWRNGREENRLRTNVNLAVNNLQDAQRQLERDRQALPQYVENVNKAVNTLMAAKSASDRAMTETNESLKRLANVVANNTSVDVTVIDLQKKLQEIPD